MRLIATLTLFICSSLHALSLAQTIQTIAGKGVMAFNGDGGPAIRASFYHPIHLALDEGRKTLYISDIFNNRIRIIDSNGIIRSHDSMIDRPGHIVLDRNGDLYVAAGGYDRCVFKLPRSGGKIRVAGNGSNGFSGDGGPAVNAGLNPTSLAFDAAGNLYIADAAGRRVRKVDAGGVITTVAGNGNTGYNGDGIAAGAASLNLPLHIQFDKSGNLLIVDGSFRIRKVNTSGIISTIAGKGVMGFSGDGGRADSAMIGAVRGMAVDAAGNLIFSDASNKRIRVIDVNGNIRTIAGRDSIGLYGDGGPALSALFWEPFGLFASLDGSLLIADAYNERVRKICPASVREPSMKIGMTHANLGAPFNRITFRPVFTPHASGMLYQWRVNGGLVSTDSVFVYAGLPNNTMVTLEVIAYNLCRPKFLDTVYVNNNPTSISGSRKQEFFTLFPNPASDIINIDAEDIPTAYHAEISDIQGRVIMRREVLAAGRNMFNISRLSAGTYYMRIYDQGAAVKVLPLTKL